MPACVSPLLRNPLLCFAVAVTLNLGLRPSTAASAEPGKPLPPQVAAASNEGQQAIARFQILEGLKVRLFAAEPLLANPAAFCFDERGRLYVAETYRLNNGVEDNRSHMDWLDDDLAAQTVEDRLAYFKKHLKDKVSDYTLHEDRIRRLEDRDGDGQAEVSTIFADGFNGILDGAGAGVFARNNKVWYTCIPNLWLLEDHNDDGQADSRKSLHYGFGVRVAFSGHDMHGLCLGPDGKLYFSIGDRGFNVTTAGKNFAHPDKGAVLRCNLDGSDLEVFAIGLRNPQELAFDDFGNLFTCDNNSDSGDKARWVYVVEGGDSGWRMSYQYFADRGPWNREKLWHPQFAGQAAWIVPPLAHVSDGPSGLTAYPGVGLPDRYQGHFFLCDFRGSAGNSGVRSFAMKPRGAAFELVDSQQFLWSILATDVDFGPDCSLYVSDWVEGWKGTGKGRVYKIENPKLASAEATEVRQLLAEGMTQRDAEELQRLLAHPHRQIRLEAQLALAARGPKSVPLLTATARESTNQLARIHAIWGLGQLARQTPDVMAAVVPLLKDADPEIRGQAAKALGEARYAAAFDSLLSLLKDPEPRVRFQVAAHLGKLGNSSAVPALLNLLRENADRDPFLRHAAVQGLVQVSTAEQLQAAAGDESPAVRLGVLLTMRRRQDPTLAQFLNDPIPLLVEEAARAINDVPLNEAMPELAALAQRSGLSEPVMDRVINANFRLGGAEHAVAVARIAATASLSDRLRREALQALGDWESPSGRDRVMGLWRPLPHREPQLAADALRPVLGSVLAAPDKVREVATKVAAKLGIKEVGPALLDLLTDRQQSVSCRTAALAALQTLKDPRLKSAVELALQDKQPAVRAAGRGALVSIDREAGLKSLQAALHDGAIIEKQAACATLAGVPSDKADALLNEQLDLLLQGKLAPELQLDILEAAARRSHDELKTKLAEYQAALPANDLLAASRPALLGGDAERGRQVFFDKAEVSCVRCHKVSGTGGEVGPDLSKIGSQQKREYILEAIVVPNRQIAKGFDSVILILESGKVLTGLVRGDDGKVLRLLTSEGQLLNIPKDQIEEQARGKSAMPEDLCGKMSRKELRDVVEFLASQRE